MLIIIFLYFLIFTNVKLFLVQSASILHLSFVFLPLLALALEQLILKALTITSTLSLIPFEAIIGHRQAD